MGRVSAAGLLVAALFEALVAAPAAGGEAVGVRVEASPALDLKACRRRPEKVWALVKLGFGEIFPSHLKEIEGAMPGRFMPKTLPFAERYMTQDGHFIRMYCLEGGGRRLCPEKRRLMEERTLKASLLRSLPSDVPYEDLYDPETWEITALGLAQLERAEACWPDLWERAARLVSAAVPPRRR